MLAAFLLCICFCNSLKSQCGNRELWLQQIIKIENENSSFAEKEKAAEALKESFEQCAFQFDSVYARILHKLAVWQYYGSGNLSAAVQNTQKAIDINTNASLKGAPSFAIGSYNNLGIFYSDHHLYNEAQSAFEQAVSLAKKTGEIGLMVAKLYGMKALVNSRLGNYQECIEDASTGMNMLQHGEDDILSANIYNYRAQAQIYLKNFAAARLDIHSAEKLLGSDETLLNQLADLYSVKAFLAEQEKDSVNQLRYQQKSIQLRKLYGDTERVLGDSIDLALYYQSRKSYAVAAGILQKVQIRSQSHEQKALAYIQLAEVFLNMSDPVKAIQNCQQGLGLMLAGYKDTSYSSLPAISMLKAADNPAYVFYLLSGKAEALHALYKQKNETSLIAAILPAFKLADAAIDEMRLRQPSENTRLYWREQTRGFYKKAIDAAYNLKDAESILYFMEKSRAVLLNDKLSELGSLALLPETELKKEQQLRLEVASLQAKKNGMAVTDEQYKELAADVLHAKGNFNRYIKSLEQRFPVYYQYKYQTVIPGIADVKKYLLTTQGSYVSYFETDSVLYALQVTQQKVSFHKIAFKGYADSLSTFLKLCSNKTLLNTRYPDFSKLSHLLYSKLVAPLQLPKGNVIISTDVNFIPFDALIADVKANHFLLYDYMFDYTYSAGYLLRTARIPAQAQPGFLGIAPESFASYLSLATLTGSVRSLENIASNYSLTKLIEHKEATRSFFLNNAGNYGLLHLYAHARVQPNGGEPVLYMSDSAISISELSMWVKPKVNFAFLAACETGAGETYIGEGVNSLARSFAAVGISSTIANLWKADNEAMYAISEKFYYYIGKGFTKSQALQQAKIDFIKNGSKEKSLPFYWGAAVLLGNADALPVAATNKWLYWVADLVLLTTAAFIMYQLFARRKRKLWSTRTLLRAADMPSKL